MSVRTLDRLIKIIVVLLLIFIAFLLAEQVAEASVNETTMESIAFKQTMLFAFNLPEIGTVALMFIVMLYDSAKPSQKKK